jgi:protein TonB
MELKKSPKCNLENKRGLFLEIGLFIALGMVFMAFEYKQDLELVEEIEYTEIAEVDDIIPISIQQKEKPQKLIKPKILELTIIDLVDDEIEDDDLIIIDAEANEDDIVEIKEIADEIEEEDDDDIVFVVAEFMPIFNPEKNKTYEEGKKDLFVWMSKKVRYPSIAQENDIQGRVFFRFMVDKKGRVSNVQIVRGVDPSLDKETLRVVSKLKNFKPAYQRQKPVNVWFSGYLNFRLQ